jgi:hypothetical protein
MPCAFCAALKRVVIRIFLRFRRKLMQPMAQTPVADLGKNAPSSTNISALKTEVTLPRIPNSQTTTGPHPSNSHEILYGEVPNLSELVTVEPGQIYKGSFSEVYRGTYEGKLVRLVSIISLQR